MAVLLSNRTRGRVLTALQVRYHIKGWAVDLHHDFDHSAPTVGCSKKLGSTRVSASYDIGNRSAGLALAAGGFRAGLSLSRTADNRWSRNPQITLSIEPLTFL